MTDEEKQRVLEMLDQLDSGERERKISSLEAFSNWLRSAATEIYNKVKDQLQRFWSTICSIFS
ncbi:hypothetical protein [Scytonema sp. UIC 10036]|uniref:hypothetical protein n=1 Tax=Scytonema sp. UIC 10036 TaxID=2304196 RepID=UPI00140FCC43|nr:hypothetical protein [Scytonema sp. UIC 10036]